MPIITLHTKIRADIQICFDLARSIDLHSISLSDTEEKAIAGRTTGLIEFGETVTWQAKHFGVRQQLTSKITAMTAPYYFVDEQIKGAFKMIYHQHIFQYDGTYTHMTDIFEFESPVGIFGKMFNRLILTKYMTRFLLQRNEVIKKYAESPLCKEVLKCENESLN